MDEKQKKIIMRCWEVILFLASLSMLIIGLIKIAKPELLGLSTEGGIALTVIGQVMLTPNTIIAMWIRQILNRKHQEKVKSAVEDTLEQNGINVYRVEKESKKSAKNKSKQANQEQPISYYGK